MREIVLLPGSMCDSDLWRDMVPDLSLLGQLHYGNLFEDDTLEGMARRVLGEVPERFVLVGFSMGGFVARVLTLMAPERVQGVAFVATSARGFSDQERARRMAGRKHPGGGNGVARGLHPDRERDPVLLERLRDMQRRLGPDVWKRQAALVRLDAYDELERIACPALVVACRQHRFRAFDETKRMADHMPRADFKVIENCGHMAPLEQPHELARLLTEWIGRARL
jgi:pimeloyl-ACP methyl ester carboxylesterase